MRHFSVSKVQFLSCPLYNFLGTSIAFHYIIIYTYSMNINGQQLCNFREETTTDIDFLDLLEKKSRHENVMKRLISFIFVSTWFDSPHERLLVIVDATSNKKFKDKFDWNKKTVLELTIFQPSLHISMSRNENGKLRRPNRSFILNFCTNSHPINLGRNLSRNKNDKWFFD